jgi:hypothetical protein
MDLSVVEGIRDAMLWLAMSAFGVIFVVLMIVWVVESRVIQRVIDDTRGQIRAVGLPMYLLLCAFAVAMSISAQKRKGDGGDGEANGFGVRGLDPAFRAGGNPHSESGVEPPHSIRGGDSGPPRVVFQSALPSSGGAPVCFTNQPDTSVQTIMLATQADAADLATLIDCTVPHAMEFARLRVVHEGIYMPEMSAMEQSLTGQFEPGRWQVIAVDFPDPVPLDALHFGNSAGRPAWQREWRGAIKEVVCFSTPPCENIRAGTANYLAVRWGFAGYPYTATPAQRQAAIEAGLNYGVAWGTVIIVK